MTHFKYIPNLVHSIQYNHPKTKESDSFKMLITSYDVDGETKEINDYKDLENMFNHIHDICQRYAKSYWHDFVITFDYNLNIQVRYTEDGFRINEIFCDKDLMIALVGYGRDFYQQWREFEFACFESCDDLPKEASQAYNDVAFKQYGAIKDIHPKLLLS